MEKTKLNDGKQPSGCPLKANLIDNIERIKVDMPSRSKKVNVSNEFIKELKELKTVEFKIN